MRSVTRPISVRHRNRGRDPGAAIWLGTVSVPNLSQRLAVLATLVTLLQCLWSVILVGLGAGWLAPAIHMLPSLLSFFAALVPLLQRAPSPSAELAQLPAAKSEAPTK